MILKVLLLGLLATFTKLAVSKECHGKPNPNAKPNLNPVYTTAPRFVRQVKNGKLFTVGDGQDQVDILHVWGSPYEMGEAHGQLQEEKARNMLNDVWQYLEEQVIEAINSTVHNIQPWFLQDVANYGLEAALELEVLATSRFTGSYFNDELRGLSDACGVDFKKIQYIHMIGELTKGGCSMFGAWGSALQDSAALLQLRALDWNVDGPFKNYPQITVYHPNRNSSNGHAFANVGWTGWIGSITGMNSKQVAISEIGVSFPDESFGKESRFGIPFTYILRDVLQFDSSLDDGINRLSNSPRTCDLILGLGDGKLSSGSGGFRGVQYSAAVARFFDDGNLQPSAAWHPRIEDVVYWGMDWLCPGYSEVLARQLQSLHGNLTAVNTIQHVLPIVQTGDLHIAIYDLTGQVMYVANARADNEEGPAMAYDRQFIRLEMTALFEEQEPQLE